MSSRSPRDFIDYIDDNSLHEDETPFLPVRPDGPLDGWSALFGGIIIGIVGGALVTIAPWLAGLLIFSGYGMTAWALGGSGRRFARDLRFGFALVAIIGFALAAGEAFVPNATWWLISTAGNHCSIFASIAALPWLIGCARYMRGFLRSNKTVSIRPPIPAKIV